MKENNLKNQKTKQILKNIGVTLLLVSLFFLSTTLIKNVGTRFSEKDIKSGGIYNNDITKDMANVATPANAEPATKSDSEIATIATAAARNNSN